MWPAADNHITAPLLTPQFPPQMWWNVVKERLVHLPHEPGVRALLQLRRKPLLPRERAELLSLGTRWRDIGKHYGTKKQKKTFVKTEFSPDLWVTASPLITILLRYAIITGYLYFLQIAASSPLRLFIWQHHYLFMIMIQHIILMDKNRTDGNLNFKFFLKVYIYILVLE